jgi:sugar-specific transcriptional regulator TrmB
MQIEALCQFGLSRAEAQIYATLLSQRESTVYQIAKPSSIARTTVYAALEQLRSRGLVSSWQKNGVAYFEAHHPQSLTHMLKQVFLFVWEMLPPQSAIQSDIRGKAR